MISMWRWILANTASSGGAQSLEGLAFRFRLQPGPERPGAGRSDQQRRLETQGPPRRYPQLLNLSPRADAAYNGAAKLSEAKTALIGAIDDYTAASEKIRTDKTVTPGAEKLVSIEDEQLMKEKFFGGDGKVRTACRATPSMSS
jgi:hypothetical protein